MSFSRVYDFETVVLRYFNVFGPRQDPNSQYAAVVPLFSRRSRGRAGHDLRRRRAVARLHVRRQRRRRPICAPPTRRARTAGSSTSPPGRRRRSTRSQTRSAGSSASRSRRRTCRAALGDIRDSWADPRDAREVLGWEPRRRARGRAAPDRREPWRGPEPVQSSPRNRPAQQGRAGAARRLSDGGTGGARVRDDARRRLARPAARARWRSSPRSAASRWSPLPDLHREISPFHDLRAAHRLAGLIRQLRPQILHTHTAKAGAVGRIAALLARRRAAADRRPHVPRPRPAGLLRPG